MVQSPCKTWQGLSDSAEQCLLVPATHILNETRSESRHFPMAVNESLTVQYTPEQVVPTVGSKPLSLPLRTWS